MWNHPDIVKDNDDNANPIAGRILTNLNQPISVVVRNDRSGTSEIFSGALGLFDPQCSGSISTVTCQGWQDDSFGRQVARTTSFNGVIKVPGSSSPLWCGIATDEMHVITVKGCDANYPSNITLSVVNARFIPDVVTFPCNAPASVVQAAFGLAGFKGSTLANRPSSPDPFPPIFNSPDNGVLPPTYSTYVDATLNAGVMTYTIGLWDPKMINTNWWEPTVLSRNKTVSVNIATFQEGGLPNSVTATKPTLAKISSVFIRSTSTPYNFTLSWYDAASSQTKTTAIITTVGGNKAISSTIIRNRMNSVVSNAVSAIASPTTRGSWFEYQLTFATTYTFTAVQRASFIASDMVNVRVNTFQTTTYPTFYSQPRGYGGSGR